MQNFFITDWNFATIRIVFTSSAYALPIPSVAPVTTKIKKKKKFKNRLIL